MAKSARASAIKKNNTALKKKVFGPVEAARNERLNAKLLELAQQQKPPREEMEVEADDAKDEAEATKEDEGMEVDSTVPKKKGFRLERNEKQKQNKASRISKSTRQRKPRNTIVFAKTGRAKAKKGNKR